DILGMIHLRDFKITTRCIRPGRTIELIESIFESEGRTCIIARAWRLITDDTSAIAELEDRAIPSYEKLPKREGMLIWGCCYIKSVYKDIRIGERRPEKGQVWLTNDLDRVEGKPTSGFVTMMGMVDTMRGVVE